MAYIENITKLENYKNYMHDIEAMPTYQLETCFSCGLPAVWLYMKAIGLEAAYFDLMARVKNRSVLFKELFYLLMLTNNNNKYFPQVPDDLLNIEIPSEVAVAQVELNKPDFELAYTFNKSELKETLKVIALPNKMIRLGNRKKAIGLMYQDDRYHVYHSDNVHALEFKDLDGCVDLIMRTIK